MREVIVLTYAKDKNGILIQPYMLVADYEGFFHKWGIDSDEYNKTYSVGIIEQADGKITLVHPTHIVFKNKKTIT